MATSVDNPVEDEVELGIDVHERLLIILGCDVVNKDPDDDHRGELFDWLVDPLRTGEEFNYVIRTLAPDVFKEIKYGRIIDYDGDDEFIDEERPAKLCFIYLGKIAAEALAVKCPVLEGPWEHVAWTLVKYGRSYKSKRYGFVSDHLSEWLINVVDNADKCPNPNLRIELMILLKNMVQLNHHNWTHALQSVMSAFCGLSVDFVMKKGSVINIMDIVHILEMFTNNNDDDEDDNDYDIDSDDNYGSYIWSFYSSKKKNQDVDNRRYMKEFNQKLASQLLDAKTSQISTIPKELHSLIALFKFTSGCAQELLKIFKEKESDNSQAHDPFELEAIAHLLKVLVFSFYISCKTPQLVNITTSCILDVLETLLLCNLIEESVMFALNTIESLLKEEFCEGNNSVTVANSTIGQELLKSHKHLKYIKESWYTMKKDRYKESWYTMKKEGDCSIREMLLVEPDLEDCPNIRWLVYNERF